MNPAARSRSRETYWDSGRTILGYDNREEEKVGELDGNNDRLKPMG